MKKNIPKIFLSSFGILFLISFLVLSISVKNAVSDYLKKRVFGELKINQMKITMKNPDSIFSASPSNIMIDDSQIKNIKKIDGLENINEIVRLNYPAYVKAGMFGMYLKTDILISGVDKTFFKDTKYKWRDFKFKDDIPVVIPMFIMDIYNNFAASNGLPALSPKALNLLSIEMHIGRSSFLHNNKKENIYKAKIFGFTDAITSAGLIVPLDFIKEYCRSQDLESGNCYSCIMLFADAKDVSQIPSITKKIKAMNLNVESAADIAEKTDRALLIFDVTLSIISGIILLLTLIAVFNAYLAIVYNRSQIFSIQRMLGASKIRIIFMFILESSIAGALYGIIGYFIGYYLLNFATDNISRWMPLVQGIDLRLGSHKYLPAAVSLSALVSCISAFIPAVFASNLNLFNAVKK